ncbi:MAG: hypothetical protein JOZ32_02660 [Bryobacterales bacterium]|nr:hypothetical protein [Bryobacterales bacterium]
MFLCAGLLCVWHKSAAGQDATPAPSAPAPQTAAEDNAANDRRMFKIVPNFKTVDDSQQPIVALSPGQKFDLAERYFDPTTFLFTGITAGFEQAANEKAGYGQGALGYGKRYGADFADGLTNAILATAVFPTLLHQDPRFHRLGQGSGWRRTGYALTRVLITNGDSGTVQFNASEILGTMTSGALSMTYYPPSDRSAGLVFTRMSFQIGYDSLFNVLAEFYPDLKRKFSRHH